VFLLLPQLVDVWDFRVFITVASREVIRRGRIRDAELYGSPDEAERRYLARYLPAQRHYRRTVRGRTRRRRTRERRPVPAGRTRAELKAGVASVA
jgi:uridine kinase